MIKGGTGMALMIILLMILLMVLGYRYLMLKKQIRSLATQMDGLACHRTEKMVDIALIDRDLEHLAAVLNQYIEAKSNTTAHALRHEEHLKESIANISHDLRTPLTVILGHLQLLQNSELTPEQDLRIRTARHKAERMKELVGVFYSLSVLDSEMVIPQKEKINLSNLLIDLLSENAPALRSTNCEPEIKLPDHSVFVYSDRSMIERIFQNLLTNAVRYSAGNIRICLSNAEDDKTIFCIENTVRVPADLNVERMFERFYTEDKSRHSESTGLGLAVVKLLVEKLDGEISAWVQSDTLMIKVVL